MRRLTHIGHACTFVPEKTTKETNNSGIGSYQMVGVSPRRICAKIAMSMFPPERIRPARFPA